MDLKKIAIFGCGNNACELVRTLERYKIYPSIYVDSDTCKQGTYFLDRFLIDSPECLKSIRDYFVVITPSDSASISDLLISWNYRLDRDFTLQKDFIPMVLSFYCDKMLAFIEDNELNASFVFAPNLMRMTNCSHEEIALKYLKDVSDIKDRIPWLHSIPPHIKKCYQGLSYYSDDYVRSIFTGADVIERNGTYVQADLSSTYVNVCGGMRVTTDQPDVYVHSVHFIGSSYIYGFGVEDKHTIPSCVQRKINDSNLPYCCLNHGIRGLEFCDYLNKMKTIPVSKHDFVIIYLKDEQQIKDCLMRRKVPYIDTNEYLWDYRMDSIFFDWGSHLNYKGNIAVANIIYALLFQNLRNETLHFSQEVSLDIVETEEMNDWLGKISKEVQDMKSGTIGAIVPHCNPFTYGHYHLIQIASQIVDHLYVFVISEDRSEFPFSDRYHLVKEGVRDLKNVKVLPSGRYIISTVTFPEYFSKDTNQSITMDPTTDVEIFGNKIARALNIQYRFVGEEPKDAVTRQYNKCLRSVLPKYGVKLIEIPRIEKNGNIVSASLVRKLYHEDGWEMLKQYVPYNTLQYLKDRKDLCE